MGRRRYDAPCRGSTQPVLLAGHPGLAGRDRHRRGRRRGLGHQQPRRHAPADRSDDRFGDGHDHRRQPSAQRRVGDGSVWVANSGDGTVSRVDPQTDRVVATIPVGQSPQALVVRLRSLWVSVAPSPAAGSIFGELHAEVLRMRGESRLLDRPGAAASASGDAADTTRVCRSAHLPGSPAPDGTRLVPDVAQAMPRVSADGRTYTFIVRSGFRSRRRLTRP